VKRQRSIAADPARTTAEAYEALVQLIVDALPRAIGVRDDLARGRPFITYLIRTEATAETPLVLLADENLDCELFTLHGMDALSAEPAIAPPGGAHATDWTLCIPVPTGAPFDASDVNSASTHFATDRPRAKPRAPRSEAVTTLGSLVDADELRKAVR
jgi:hypothetical protein